MSDSIPFFNIIRIPAGKEAEALEIWKNISDYMERSDGCLSTRLHRNLKDPSLLINHAHFESMAAFSRLTQEVEFRSLSEKLTELGVEREAGVYEVIHSFGGSSAP